MIVVRVEIWPGGDRKHARHLGTATITNNGNGTPARGNYFARFYAANKVLWRTANVAGFPRRQLLAWDLLFRALRSAVADRNPLSKPDSLVGQPGGSHVTSEAS